MSKEMEQVVKLAENHGLTIRKETLEVNNSGLDFQVVFATDISGREWVLRIPRREDVVSTAKKEKDILDRVKGKLPIQVPVWEVFSQELIAYQRLEGVPAGTIDPEAKAYVWEIDEQNVPLLFHKTLGEAMTALHRVNRVEDPQAQDLRKSMQDRMEIVKRTYGVSEELWQRWQAWLSKEEWWPKHKAFVHGDLHAGHILINKEARVTGFIDWTEARIDDPGNDFAVHLAAFGEGALHELIKEYEVAGGRTWPHMFEHIKELLAAYPVAIAEFAIKSGSEEYKLMAKQALGTAES
ncbi:macrolide 2'-phosphotransferase [Halobacillus sp. A5]|uniref:macrolide 2'-phosphotransferase n=1 Tax=Halobacillus sp. A5 TaxID=2880263 RepID=UPI0020A63DFF|nr:macrolide 2'-phosphotransferase [Halobacillus sp. A5]MCP3028320.1 macrolide 2'-phosphotransferase [Halobacillus sp. A5]